MRRSSTKERNRHPCSRRLPPSDDSSAQGRGLSSATTLYLQAPSQTALPKPEHRPQWWRNAKIGGLFTTPCTITRGDLPLQKTIYCLATLRSRLLMQRSAVRGLRLIATSRRGARDLSCSHGGDSAARKVRASASEVKGGGGYDHPLTHGQVFQRDKRLSNDRDALSLTVRTVARRRFGRSKRVRPDHCRSRTDLTLPSPPTR